MARPQLVILLHGIRTDAHWAEMVRSVLSSEEITVKPLRYGRSNLFSFLCPLFTRSVPVRDIHRKIRTLAYDHRDKDISIIAHSFGTYILSHILLRDRNFDVQRIILCGSVVHEKFDWDQVRRQILSRPLVNECGSLDVFPVLARQATFGYGPTGTFGFGGAIFEDRFHQFGHSDYFDDAFVREYWAPYFRGEALKRTPWETSGAKRTPWWVTLVSFVPIRWMAIVFLVWGLVHVWASYGSMLPKVRLG